MLKIRTRLPHALAFLTLGGLAIACGGEEPPPSATEAPAVVESLPTATPMPTEAPVELVAEPLPPYEAPTLVPYVQEEMAVLETQAIAPVVQLISPPNGASLPAGQPVSVRFAAADNNGLDRIELAVNEVPTIVAQVPNGQKLYIGVVTWPDPPPGDYQVAIRAFDVDGAGSAVTTSQVIISEAATPELDATAAPAGTVEPAPSGDSTLPSVSITLDPTETAVGTDVDLYVNAVDESGIVKLEVYVDDEMVDSRSWEGDPAAAPRSVFKTFVWRGAEEGQFDVYVRAIDAAGNVGQSLTERIDVNPAP